MRCLRFCHRSDLIIGNKTEELMNNIHIQSPTGEPRCDSVFVRELQTSDEGANVSFSVLIFS